MADLIPGTANQAERFVDNGKETFIPIVSIGGGGSGGPTAFDLLQQIEYNTRANGEPINTSLPAITGNATYGATLSASSGAWYAKPVPEFTYQWRYGSTDIAGATSATYTTTTTDVGQVIRVVVTATNSEGTASSTSLPTTQITRSPTNTAVPTITGTAAVGQTLTGTNGTWSAYPTAIYTRQWKAGGVAITGATGSTFVVTPDQIGLTITLAVTATNVSGSSSATSAATSAVTPELTAPVNTAIPIISGIVTAGQTLTTTNGTWSGNPAPTYTYQWRRDGVAISGATSSTYVLAAADVGGSIDAVVTATNSVGTASATCDAIGPVVGIAPANTVSPLITGVTTVGEVLTVSNGTWTGIPTPTFAIEWKRDGAVIGGATAATYTLSAPDVGAEITATVTATNIAGSANVTTVAVGPVVEA